MINLRERIPPRLKMLNGHTLLFLLICLVLPQMSCTTVEAAGEWLPENDRIEVNLAGVFQDVEGNNIDFAEFRDEVLLLNFWATWCPPCLMEMPSMASLYEEFGNKGLRVVAITNEDVATVRHFVSRNPYPFTFLIDTEGRLSERLRVWALPLTIILDRTGKLTYFHQGAQLWDTPNIKKRLMQLVKE